MLGEFTALIWQNGRMQSSVFPPAERGQRGYDQHEVDLFFEQAKASFEGSAEAEPLTAESVRAKAFRLKRSGYSTAHVDAALDRLEDVFASRAKAERSELERTDEARELAQQIVNRLARPSRQRFRHVGPLTLGYNRAEVDLFCDKLTRYFTEGWPLVPADVRTVVFRERRGGYQEAQVDALLDSVVTVMLKVG